MPNPFGYDPFDDLDPTRRIARGRAGAAYPELGEPEADSAIKSLTDASISGLGYVGSEIDKLFGDRAIRGLLGGKPRELLSLIPGSDVVGLTDPKDTVQGEDLLRGLGYDPSQGNWLERNLAGPALETAISPSTWLGGIGGLKAAGKAAQKTGALAKTLPEAIELGQRGLVFGISGPTAAKVARVAGAAPRVGVNIGKKLPVVGPLVRGADAAASWARPRLRSMFAERAGPQYYPEVQHTNEFARLPHQEAMEQGAAGVAADAWRRLAEIEQAGADPDEMARFITQYGENWVDNPPPAMMPHAQGLKDVADTLRREYGLMPPREQAMGLKSNEWQSYFDNVDYATRRSMSHPGMGDDAFVEKVFKVSHPSQTKRMDIFDQPGGTAQVGDWIRDPRMSGAARTMRPRQISKKIKQAWLSHALNQTTGSLPIDFPDVARKRAAGLTKRLGQTRPEFLDTLDIRGNVTKKGAPFWAQDPVGNFLLRAKRGAKAEGGSVAVQDILTRHGKVGVPSATSALRLIKDTGLTGRGALESGLRAVGADPNAIVAAAHAAAQAQGLPGADELKALRDALRPYGVPQDIAKATTEYMTRYNTPHEVGPLQRLADSALNLWKTGVYSVFPASHGRNLPSGLYEAWMTGGTRPWSRSYLDADAALKGHGIDAQVGGIAGAIEDQRHAIMREAYQEGLIGSPSGELNQTIGMRVPDVTSGNPMAPKPGFLATAAPWVNPKAYWQSIKDPLGVAGVGGRTAHTNPLAIAGQQAGQWVEDRLRLGQYLDLRRKGYNQKAAADLVRKAQIDYSRLTDFERNKMKRLVPFYSFSSRNIPKQFQRAIESPGRVGAPIRFAGGGEDEGYVPEYLRSGLAIPLSRDLEAGTQGFATALGLPFEEAFGRLKIGPNLPSTAAKTGENLLSLVRPELRYLLEETTGKQFWTGRELKDLRPGTLESSIGLDPEHAGLLTELMTATPASRALSTANRMIDPRKSLMSKAVSLATGVKLSDVDIEKWRAIDARHKLEEALQHREHVKESHDFYAVPEARAAGAVTPQEAYELQLYNTIKSRAREAAKEKRVGVRSGG